MSAVDDYDSDGHVKIWNVAAGAEVGSHGGFTLRSDDSVLRFRGGSRIVRRRRVLNLGCFADAHASRPHSRGMLVLFHSRRESPRERFARLSREDLERRDRSRGEQLCGVASRVVG